MKETGLTVEYKVQFKAGNRGRRRMAVAKTAVPLPTGRVPRLSRLMALALRFEELLASGEVRDYAELARLGHVTRARLTQIMNLLNLAPDIQEALLFLPLVERGREPVKEWMLRPVCGETSWNRQRRKFSQVCAEAS